MWASVNRKLLALDDPTFFVGIIHAGNTSRKQTRGYRWRPYPVAGHSLADGRGFVRGLPMSRPTALISAARGIGDILRVTPLVRVCLGLGYDVDLLLAPDYPGVAELLERSDTIRRVFLLPGPWSGAGQRRTDGLDRESYDVAVFTTWSLTFRHLVRARRTLAFDQSAWLRDGDTASIRRIARALGWTEPLPPPFASPSSRRFALADGTVALHPGCKPDWPWKKWHGFDDLARRLPHVAIVGSPHDAENARTYFGRPFVWPAHVQDFVGALSLAGHRGARLAMRGARGQRLRADAPRRRAGRADVRHLRHHEPAARVD